MSPWKKTKLKLMNPLPDQTKIKQKFGLNQKY